MVRYMISYKNQLSCVSQLIIVFGLYLNEFIRLWTFFDDFDSCVF
uniref:Uncharacterized protein n=1 Tax=Heterorhabditis bacteriophora TaxID=37862 RepID=A0A1I7X282_HETBA